MRWASAVPPTAELIRNIMMATQYVQDHVIHFYHLHALDWVDIVNALKADPKKAAELAQSFSKWDKNTPAYFSGVQDKIKAFAASGLGIFANGYWGHPAYKLPPEVNLIARGALSRRAGVAEGNRQDSRGLRRQESASELPGRRSSLLDQCG